VISDVHGNLAALDAVLEDIERRAAEQIVNLGDAISGPLQPRETAERLRALGFLTISGNHERQLLTLPREQMGATDLFADERIGAGDREWMAGFPGTATLSGDMLLCHGTPASDSEYLMETVSSEGIRAASAAEIEARVAGWDASLIFCGHSHLPRVVWLEDGRIVANPGSVGLQAYSAEWPHRHVVETGSPHARYALAERSGDAWSIELVRVAYDWESAARLAEANGRADWAVALRTGHV